jgi:hypothetical protein
MKLICKYIFIIVLSFCALCTKAQNLVPNPSFENYDTCPHYYGYLHYSEFWFNPNITNIGTPDLFNVCCIGGEVDIPSNSIGTQLAKTGNGYAGFCPILDTLNSREYIEVELINSLVQGQAYCVEFYVSLAEISSISTSNIGVYFSNDSLLDTTQANAISFVSPQVENDSMLFLVDKTSWMKIFGNFIAQGGEKFMTIGNFRNTQNSQTQNVLGGVAPFAYYYIDDVSVMDCNDTITSINEVEINYHFSVYPNPNNGSFTVEYAIEENDQADLCIYSIEGRKIACHKLNSAEKKIKIQENLFSNGMYFYQIHLNGNVAAQDRLIIIK